MGLLGVGLWVAHLSTIVWAVQDRAEFEATVRHGLPGGFALSPFAPWLALAVLVVVARGLWLARTGRREPAPFRVSVGDAAVLVLLGAHLAGVGLGGSLLQAPDYDRWCAALSATWHAIPLSATMHLLAVVLIAAAARNWLERASIALWPRYPRAARNAGYAAALSLTALGAACVLQLATGSYAVFSVSLQ
jgi:hypothetical protein